MSNRADLTHPPRRILMGPGPSDIHPRVLSALARPTVGHLDPYFIALMDDIKARLQYAFQTENALTMPVSGPGTAGMETCVVNLVEPGDVVVIGQNGVFGGRLAEMVRRAGGEAIVVEHDWGLPVDPARIAEAVAQAKNVKAVAFVHAETSTGASSNAAEIANIARKHGALSIVDAVTSLGGSELRTDDWGLDAVYSGSQKCLSCTPGLSPITFSERAVAAVKARRTPVQSWFLDVGLVIGYWGAGRKRSYHHTAPINALYGLHESLVALQEEGLEAAWARHRHHHLALAAGLEVLGLDFVVDADHRLAQLNAVRIPAGVDDAAVRSALLNEYGIEIGGGLGALAGSVWRIGLMGYAARKDNVLTLLGALQTCLNTAGADVDRRSATAAARACYAGSEAPSTSV